MRKKEQRIVITFHTTAEAVAAEKLLKQQEILGRLIPVPREISSGCGLAWSSPAEEEHRLNQVICEKNLVFKSVGEYLI